LNAKIPFLWAPNRGCKHTHIYFMNLLICLRDTELFLLYQMVIIYSPVQIHQEYPTFTYFIQEWVFYKGACKYYISRFSQILDPPPKRAYIILERSLTHLLISIVIKMLRTECDSFPIFVSNFYPPGCYF